MKRIAIAVLLIAVAAIGHATRPVPGHTEQDVVFEDVWRVSISRATFQDPGDPLPPPRQGLLITFDFEIRDEFGEVRRRGQFSEEPAGGNDARMRALVVQYLSAINASEGL